ncbi:MAG: segregation/condensation protein A [Nannocystaceae bacterium]
MIEPGGAEGVEVGGGERLTLVGERANAVYAVELPTFEGPLDLLLHLVRRHELDILDIPIAFVAEKYLEYLSVMQALDIEIAGEYLVMAATLAYLKSRELLPQEASGGEGESGGDEDGEDPREALIRRLIEYERYRAASAELEAMPVVGRDVFGRGGDVDLPPLDPGMAPVTLFRLAEAYARVLQRAKINKSHEVTIEAVTVRQRMEQLSLILDERQRVDFDALFLERTWSSVEELRAMLVVTLMSVLEMVKLGLIGIQQPDSTETIRIERRASHAQTVQALSGYDEEASYGDVRGPRPPAAAVAPAEAVPHAGATEPGADEAVDEGEGGDDDAPTLDRAPLAAVGGPRLLVQPSDDAGDGDDEDDLEGAGPEAPSERSGVFASTRLRAEESLSIPWTEAVDEDDRADAEALADELELAPASTPVHVVEESLSIPWIGAAEDIWDEDEDEDERDADAERDAADERPRPAVLDSSDADDEREDALDVRSGSAEDDDASRHDDAPRRADDSRDADDELVTSAAHDVTADEDDASIDFDERTETDEVDGHGALDVERDGGVEADAVQDDDEDDVGDGERDLGDALDRDDLSPERADDDDDEGEGDERDLGDAIDDDEGEGDERDHDDAIDHDDVTHERDLETDEERDLGVETDEERDLGDEPDE